MFPDQYDESLLEDISSARQQLQTMDKAVVDAVTRQLLRTNTAQKGLIMWLKPGVSRNIDPRPIHLEETIAFFEENSSYPSSGKHIFDIHDIENVEDQYSAIDDFVRHGIPTDMSTLPHSRKSLDIAGILQKWRERYGFRRALTPADIAKLQIGMKEMTKTSNKMLDDICNRRVRLNENGKYNVSTESYIIHVFLYITFCSISLSDEFSYSNEYKITKKEVVFYYLRKEYCGLYFRLYKEFERALALRYRPLPLIRPSCISQAHSQRGNAFSSERIQDLHAVSQYLLQTTADRINQGREAVSREGLNKNTVDADGEHVLATSSNNRCPAVTTENFEATVGAVVGNKRSRVVRGDEGVNAQVMSIRAMTKVELKLFADKKKIKVKANSNKDTLRTAIFDSLGIDASDV